MRLEHQFRVAAPIDEVWSALLDPRRVAPCMPGATLGEVTDESFTGSVKVKLGPVALLYKGTGSFSTVDAEARRAVLKASGKDSRGNGTASATVEVTLSAETGGTVAHVVTDLSVTGRPAQFGRGMITEVGGRILDRFAECLAGKLAPEPVVDEPVVEQVESLDLTRFAGTSVAKRVAVVIGLAVLLIVVVGRLRRR